MATLAPPRTTTLAPDLFERVLAVGAVVLLAAVAVVLLAAVAVALVKGRAEWAVVPNLVWLHLLTITVVVALTPAMLLRRRGDRRHRTLGWIWVTAMLTTAASSFFIREGNDGGFSVIHILSGWTLVQVPLIVWSARTHNVRQHRSAVRGMVAGALLVAGFFTFPFDRMLGHWLFS